MAHYFRSSATMEGSNTLCVELRLGYDCHLCLRLYIIAISMIMQLNESYDDAVEDCFEWLSYWPSIMALFLGRLSMLS